MAKKKPIVESVALFDEEPPVKKAPVQAKKKEIKKKKNETSNSSTDNTGSVVNNRQRVHKKVTKEVEKTTGGKRQNTSSATKKSGSTFKPAVKNSSRTKSDKDSNRRSVKSDKNTSDKGTARRAKKDAGDTGNPINKSKDKGTDIAAKVVRDGSETKKPDSKRKESDDLFKEAKKHKHKFTRGSEIMAPKQITGKPKTISDDLVAVIIDGEYYEVSPWSIKNGMYYQGFDSHFLVNYLHYDSVSTKYDEIDAQYREKELNTKKKTKK